MRQLVKSAGVMLSVMGVTAGVFAGATSAGATEPASAGSGDTAAPTTSGTPAAVDAIGWQLCNAVDPKWDKEDQATLCGTVSVPLDYAAPDGAQLKLRVTKIPAKVTAERRGVLLLNPGGPGEPGAGLPKAISGSAFRAAGDRFDLIGFDPRGIGASDAPACAPGADLSAVPIADAFRVQMDGVASCLRQNQQFTSQLRTSVIARDMDRIRVALGEQKVSYYGISWGSWLGAVYRSMFDDHVDRMVIDSVLTPERDALSMQREAARVGESNFARFADYLAVRADTYRLGSTRAAVHARVVELMTALEGKQVEIDSSEVQPSGNDNEPAAGENVDRPQITKAVFGKLILASWADRAKSAAQIAQVSAKIGSAQALPATVDMSATSGWESGRANMAIACSDLTSAVGDQAGADAARRSIAQAYPLGQYAMQFGFVDGCIGMPVERDEVDLRAGTSPLQLIGHRDEVVTPYRDAVSMRRAVGGGLLTMTDDLHGAANSACAARTAIQFLNDGKQFDGSCGYDATDGFAAEWSATNAYSVGDTVSFNGTVFECLQSHQGWGDRNWINAPSLWRELS